MAELKEKAAGKLVDSLNEAGAEPGTITKGMWHLGLDAAGVSEPIPFIIVNGKEKGPTLWIQACVHGVEFGSAWTVSSLAREIDPSKLKGRLILLPILNISAFRARQPNSPIDNGNLYNMFPGNPAGSYSEQIAYVIGTELVNSADYMIDIHNGTSVVRCTEFASYPWGLKASAESEKMALATNSPIIVRRSVRAESDKRLTFFYACAEGIPSVMFTIGGHRRVEPQFTDPIKERCKNIMRFLKMLPGDVAPAERARVLSGNFFIRATKNGFIFNEVENGQWIEKGQVIARLFNVFGEELEAVRCPLNKAIVFETSSGVLYPGEIVAGMFIPQEES